MNFFSAAKPVDGVPSGSGPTNQEDLTTEQLDMAAEGMEDFDIIAAAKLVQKHHPSTLLSSDIVLLSDDEEDTGEPLPKRTRVATEAGGSQAAPKVAEPAKQAKTQ